MKKYVIIQILALISSISFADSAKYEGFEMNKILQGDNTTSDLHYHLYLPDSYNGKEPYALYISLPGYGSYYFQGAGVNLRHERFATEAKRYNSKMIIAAPQPDDWGQNSKRQILALTEYLLGHYAIDRNKVYISGYSGGGETLSLAVSERPELFTAALHVSSKWDGGFDKIAVAMTPVYFVIGENDEYYSSRPAKDAYNNLRDRYQKAGVSAWEIDKLAVLDVKSDDYFAVRNMTNQHGGGALVAYDKAVMGWLFGTHQDKPRF